MVVIGQSGCNWEKVVVFGQKGCIRESGFIQAKWLYSVKVVVFGQSGCVREKVVVFG